MARDQVPVYVWFKPAEMYVLQTLDCYSIDAKLNKYENFSANFCSNCDNYLYCLVSAISQASNRPRQWLGQLLRSFLHSPSKRQFQSKNRCSMFLEKVLEFSLEETRW